MNGFKRKQLALILLISASFVKLSADDYIPSFLNAPLTRMSSEEITCVIKNGIMISDSASQKIYFQKRLTFENKSTHKDGVQSLEAYSAFCLIDGENGSMFKMREDSQFNFTILSNSKGNLVIFIRFINQQGDFSDSLIFLKTGEYWIKTIQTKSISGNDWNEFDLILFPSYFMSTYYINNQEVTMYKETLIYKDHGEYYFKFNNISFEIYFEDVTDYKGKNISYYTYINDDNVRLRTSSSLNGKILQLLSNGTRLRILQINPEIQRINNEDGVWVLVALQGTEREIGWIWSKYIQGFSIRH